MLLLRVSWTDPSKNPVFKKAKLFKRFQHLRDRLHFCFMKTLLWTSWKNKSDRCKPSISKDLRRFFCSAPIASNACLPVLIMNNRSRALESRGRNNWVDTCHVSNRQIFPHLWDNFQHFRCCTLPPARQETSPCEVIPFTKIGLFSAKQPWSARKSFDLSIRCFQKETAQSWAPSLIAGSDSLPSYVFQLTQGWRSLGVHIFRNLYHHQGSCRTATDRKCDGSNKN